MLSLPPIGDPVRDTLDAHVRHFSHLVTLATIAVAIGVALELVEIFHDVIARLKRKRRERCEHAVLEELAKVFPASNARRAPESHSEEPRWVKRVLRVGLITVVIGVVGEWRYGSKLEDAHSAIHQYDLGKIAAADEKAGDAAKSAKIAHDEADAIKLEADSIQTRLNVASEQLAMIEHKVRTLGPRWESLEAGENEFIAKLKPFAGQRIVIAGCGLSGPDALEPEQLRWDLVRFLGKPNGAGWLVQWADATWSECLIGTQNVPPAGGGNVIFVSPLPNNAVKGSAPRAAKALNDTLNKLMITTRMAPDTRVAVGRDISSSKSVWAVVEEDPTAVVLLVGTNPGFSLTKRRTK